MNTNDVEPTRTNSGNNSNDLYAGKSTILTCISVRTKTQMPPWLDVIVVEALPVRGLARSSTRYPGGVEATKLGDSAESCHDSTTANKSSLLSTIVCETAADLLPSDRTLREPIEQMAALQSMLIKVRLRNGGHRTLQER